MEVIQTGEHADALAYELADMEKAIRGDAECMHLDYTKDVMGMMTGIQKRMGISVSGRCKLWYETHLFQVMSRASASVTRFFYIAQSLA